MENRAKETSIALCYTDIFQLGDDKKVCDINANKSPSSTNFCLLISMNAAIKCMFAMWMQYALTPRALITALVRMDTLEMDTHVMIHALDINYCLGN